MFGGDLKKRALEALERSQDDYREEISCVTKQCETLFSLRESCSEKTIVRIEEYVNSLANTPKSFKRDFEEVVVTFKEFKNEISALRREVDKGAAQSGSAAAATAAGIGVAALGPSALMGIATTFGTASTGTAISALTGAAASNAALAWLGGGALAAGGGGMVAGNLLLTLTGPVGWAIAGGSTLVGGLLARKRNKKIAEEATRQEKKVRRAISETQRQGAKVQHLIDLTKEHKNGVTDLLRRLELSAPNDYLKFDAADKDNLAALLNHVRSLAELITKRP